MDQLHRVLSILMYRHGKESVQSELILPPLTVTLISLPLSDVEHIKYSKLMRKCSAIIAHQRMSPQVRHARLCRLLLLLRKLCCCPFLVGGKRTDAMQASEALPIMEIKKRICRESELEVDVANRARVKCLTRLATSLAFANSDYQQAEEVAQSALDITEKVVQRFLSDDDSWPNRIGTRIESLRIQAGKGVILETLGRIEDARQLFLQVHDQIDGFLSTQLMKHGESTSNAQLSLDEMFGICSNEFTLAVFRLMMGVDIIMAIDNLARLDTRLSAFLSDFDEEISTTIEENPKVLACSRGRLVIELRVSLHRRTLLRDLIALRTSILDCLVDLKTLSIVDESAGDIHCRNLSSCKELLELLPVGRNRDQIGFVPEPVSDDNEEEENYRRAALGSNRVGFRLDPELIDYLVLQGSIMTGLLRTADKLHINDDHENTKLFTSRVSMISIVLGKEPASISSRCSSWIAVMFAVLRTALFLRQMITNSDENDRIAGQCWERCFCIREELPNLYRRAFDLLEQMFEEIRSGEQNNHLAAFDLQRAKIDLSRAENELRQRENENRYIMQKFDQDFERDEVRIRADDDICPICRCELQSPIVTPCGHLFCSSCLSSYMKDLCEQQCPLRCRNRFSIQNCLAVDQSIPEQGGSAQKSDQSAQMVAGEYGAKISDLLRRIIEIRIQDPTAKSLVFSQWVDVLNVCRLALEEYGIKCVQLRGDARAKSRCIDQFLNGADISVFLIPMAAGASGLTMVAARFAFIMEPNLNPNIEDQAINRIHRIGQTHPTHVVRYVAKCTVEEKIAAIQQTRRVNGDLEQKGFAPEVFDESILNDIFQ